MVGDQWDNCSSLRITHGHLMETLSNSYDELAKLGLVRSLSGVQSIINKPLTAQMAEW